MSNTSNTDPYRSNEFLTEHANCKGMSINVFFPYDRQAGRSSQQQRDDLPSSNRRNDLLNLAKQTCSACTVTKECLQYAIDHECIGIWGNKFITSEYRIKEIPTQGRPKRTNLEPPRKRETNAHN